MVRRSTPQSKIDDRAFPIRVMIDITHKGADPAFFDFMREVGSLQSAYHGAGHNTGVTQCIAVYFRHVRDFSRFFQRFPDTKLADGVAGPTYTSPALSASQARERMAVDPGYVTLGQLEAAEGNEGMCNRYQLKHMPAEVADMFRATIPSDMNAGPGEVHPGEVGMVVAEGQLRSMVWGFPFAPISKKTGERLALKPVNNTREDKLDTYMWRASFERRRCLIPVSAFAEAEGEKGRMTRTWFSLPDQETFAVAGLWSDSDEWGAVYSMIMTDSAGAAAEVHDRMPVILPREDWSMWTRGTPSQARDLCHAYVGELHIDRTDEPWSAAKKPAAHDDSMPTMNFEKE